MSRSSEAIRGKLRTSVRRGARCGVAEEGSVFLTEVEPIYSEHRALGYCVWFVGSTVGPLPGLRADWFMGLMNPS